MLLTLINLQEHLDNLRPLTKCNSVTRLVQPCPCCLDLVLPQPKKVVSGQSHHILVAALLSRRKWTYTSWKINMEPENDGPLEESILSYQSAILMVRVTVPVGFRTVKVLAWSFWGGAGSCSFLGVITFSKAWPGLFCRKNAIQSGCMPDMPPPLNAL